MVDPKLESYLCKSEWKVLFFHHLKASRVINESAPVQSTQKLNAQKVLK